MWYSLQRTLSHGTSTSQTHTTHVVQSSANSHAWDKYIIDTRSPCGTVRSELSRMGQVHHRHTQPMWYSLQRTLTHGASTSQTHTTHVGQVQSAANSLAWDKYITDTHNPCGTVLSELSRMGQVHHRHTQPMWYSPQRTLTHGTSTSQTHTAHVVQSAVDSLAWDKYITDTHSPCGTVRSGLSAWDKYITDTHSPCGTVRSTLTHGTSTSQTQYSPQRTLTHGTSTSQTHTAHVVQSTADSHAWDKYITDTHSPCGTVRSGLSRMGQVHHRHTQPMWYSPQRTLMHGTSTSQTVRHTQPMWYSPQRTLTHGTSTSQTHTAHVVQSAADSHAWDKYITDTHSPCSTVHSGLSRMGQVHHRHTQPMWYSPQRTLTHGTSTSQTHTAHVVQSAADSHAWDKYITDTHSPCGTVRSGLSRMGQVHHRHTQPMWYSPQRTLTHGASTSQTHITTYTTWDNLHHH